jgi:hypothetical protein
MRKKRQTKLVKIKNKLALSANDHMAYDWIIDFGTTQHMTFEREWFITYESIIPQRVYMGDDTILEAIGNGSIKATMQVGGKMLLTIIGKQFQNKQEMKHSRFMK